jgi:hypothetical protein
LVAQQWSMNYALPTTRRNDTRFDDILLQASTIWNQVKTPELVERAMNGQLAHTALAATAPYPSGRGRAPAVSRRRRGQLITSTIFCWRGSISTT